MAALTTERSTFQKDGLHNFDPLAANVRAYAGAILVVNAAGNVQPCTTATGLTGRGICEETADNTGGAAGAVSVKSRRRGWHKVANAGDITRAHINLPAYGVDDQTISASSATSTRSQIGVIRDVDSDGVWFSFT